MGLIIKNKIRTLMKGYPTVSDKYNVAPALLAGTTDVEFGDPLVAATSTSEGCPVKSAIGTNVVTAGGFVGFAVATNVKTPATYPASGTGKFEVGEAIGVLINGFLAVKLEATTTVANIKPNAKVYITANGVLTLTAGSNFDTGYVCTGVYEDQGTSSAHVIIAEVCKA